MIGLATLILVSATAGAAQPVATGAAQFAAQCAQCHGADAKGLNGPSLTTLWPAASDDRVFQTIRRGVPGSIMPPSTASDDEIRAIIAYLKVSRGTPASLVSGAGTRAAAHADDTRRTPDTRRAQE